MSNDLYMIYNSYINLNCIEKLISLSDIRCSALELQLTRHLRSLLLALRVLHTFNPVYAVEKCRVYSLGQEYEVHTFNNLR